MNSSTISNNISLMADQLRDLVKAKPSVKTLHLYMDCSGSNDPWDHYGPITSLIDLAKELHLELEFSSFSHYCSPPTRISDMGRETDAIWNAILLIERVSGGTDFVPVWNGIGKDTAAHQAERLNIIITDFEYSLPAGYRFAHPCNLYYTACYPRSTADMVPQFAADFAESMVMTNTEPDIRSRILGLTL